ncbi:hypothetical protein BDW74DRAFT_177341 [Aspergillus multicolor]|uniref:putative ABC multidrug transporter n=1 Tax=Aspergillus multicolor TaxID=41759 RepID=UPI003CCCFD53
MPFTTGDGGLLHLNQQDFDFNLEFEQLFFSIIPSALFIPTSLWRTLSQAKKPAVVNAPAFQFIKLGAIILYVGLELALLILAVTGSFHVTGIFIASSVLKLVSALFMLILSVVDHRRSPRPSVLLNSYLFVTLLLDAAQARTLFLSSDNKPETIYSSIFCASTSLKMGIFLLEACQKTKWVTWDAKKHSPEETSGIFSLGVFFWLNRLFLAGYKKVLAIEDLYPLDSSLNAQGLHEDFVKNLDYSKLKGDQYGLVKALMRTLKVPLLLPIAPRLALVGFTFCQPIFIERLLDYLAQPKPDANVGYGLIGASILIYAGIGVSYALYWYFHHRLRTMIRSILVTETFVAATRARLGTSDDSAALTLMSTDMERIRMGLRSVHETWASTVQVALAGWMLYRQLGIVFIAPVGVALLCFLGLGILVNFTGDAQRAWMSGVQKRVGLTATVIASMKSLKISGLTAAVGEYVQQLRVDELAAGARYRKIAIIAAVFAFIPQLLAPPLTFAFSQRTLDASRIFTSLSFLTLLTSPLMQLFQAIPQIVAAVACIGRIQTFLESEPCHDFRQVLIEEKKTTDFADAFVIKNASFGWRADKIVLQDVTTYIPASSLTMIVGPVGSGKSTLCKALLGEIPFSKGRVSISKSSPSVGFCEQTAFLWNGTVKDNIVGFSSFDRERYTQVIEATALGIDLAGLPQGDLTNIGSDGVALSGGQKQRVSLARALYLHTDMLILDDVFSGLDADTEEQVFRQVFGEEGLLRRRGSTVVLCTHSIRHLPAANYIIALGDGGIVEQGTFQSLSASRGYVQRLGLDAEKSVPKNDIKPQLMVTIMPDDSSLPLPSSEVVTPRQVGDASVYKHYIQSMGWFVAGCSLFFAALWGFFTNFPTIWLTYWSDAAASAYPTQPHAFYAGIYALFQISGMIALLSLAISLWIVSVKKAGAHLHQQVLRTLLRAPLLFFTNTDTGVVTNMFSQDLNLIDTELPDATLDTLICVFQSIGQAAVMLTSSAYLSISYPLLGALLYAVQKFYLRTSRQLRLLDLEAKSPLYTHFIDTIKGIATLRASGFLHHETRKNTHLVDSSQRAAYLLLMIQEWLNIILNLVVMVLAAVLTTLAIRLQSNSAFAGASLFSLMSFGQNLSGIVTSYTQLETSIGAIARLKVFNESTESEEKEDEDIIPPEEWPEKGAVEIRGVNARYGAINAKQEPDSLFESTVENLTALALDNITLSIRPGEKVAICGRTGSGKSSLLALLLKLLDPLPRSSKIEESSITIDGIPLHQIHRPTLRDRLIAVPQDAVFLPDGSTLRANLDPSDTATKKECQDVLKAIGLDSNLRLNSDLDLNTPINTGTFSAGQRQLLSLGRALLRRRIRDRVPSRHKNSISDAKGGILLLDEVSSSVDRETERVMQEIIKTEFANYTVIAVSHRLDMVMEFDTVVVMDKGRIVEVGNPRTLRRMEGSWFGGLVRAAGAGSG